MINDFSAPDSKCTILFPNVTLLFPYSILKMITDEVHAHDIAPNESILNTNSTNRDSYARIQFLLWCKFQILKFWPFLEKFVIFLLEWRAKIISFRNTAKMCGTHKRPPKPENYQPSKHPNPKTNDTVCSVKTYDAWANEFMSNILSRQCF